MLCWVKSWVVLLLRSEMVISQLFGWKPPRASSIRQKTQPLRSSSWTKRLQAMPPCLGLDYPIGIPLTILMNLIFHEMELHGVDPASVHTFGAVIDGQLPKAFEAYGIMISKVVKPNRVIFNTLINAWSRTGAVQRAFDVLTDMKSEATPVKSDHVGKALEICESMRVSNVKGSPEFYMVIVHARSEKVELDYALTVYDDLKQDGVEPDEVFSSLCTNFENAAVDGGCEMAFECVVLLHQTVTLLLSSAGK